MKGDPVFLNRPKRRQPDQPSLILVRHIFALSNFPTSAEGTDVTNYVANLDERWVFHQPTGANFRIGDNDTLALNRSTLKLRNSCSASRISRQPVRNYVDVGVISTPPITSHLRINFRRKPL
jgi:hypothetical protein